MKDNTQTLPNTTKMPHSVTPEGTAVDQMGETENKIESQVSGATMAASDFQNEDSQNSAKGDMTMADVAVEEDKEPKTITKAQTASEVKLEDLFADIDSDEEFPSSAPGVKVEGSPEESASPMYV